MADLLTLTEAAEYLRTSVQNLYNWRSARTGPPSVKVGRRVLYRRSDLDAWIEERFEVDPRAVRIGTGSRVNDRPDCSVIEWRDAVLMSDLTATQKLVAIVCAEFVDCEDGAGCDLGLAPIMAKASLSRRAVHQARKKLEDDGWLVLVNHGGSARGEIRSANSYRFVIPAESAEER